MRHRTHDHLVGWGFGLAYLADLAATIAGQADLLAPLRHPIQIYACLPAAILGIVMVAVAHLVPIAEDLQRLL